MSDEHQGQQPVEPAGPPQPQDQAIPEAQQPSQQYAVEQPFAAPQQQPLQPQPNGTPQWIPAAPPHPYASSQPAAASVTLKVLAITSMAAGLLSLLTLAVALAYFNPGIAIIGAAIGVVALAIGIVALVKKARPIGAAITGVGTGAISTLASLVLVAIGALAFTQFQPVDVPLEESWDPGTKQEALLDWPANMSTGGIIFEGPGDPLPRSSDPLQPGTAPQPNQVNREAGNDILVYVDYRCPHCMQFEQENGEYLTELIGAGDTSVEIVPLSFMDRMSADNFYSSRAAGAVACFTTLQPEGAWKAHNTLLTNEVQPGPNRPGLSNDELIAALEQGVGEMDSSVRDCIKSEHFVQFAQGLNDWVFKNPVPNTIANAVRVEGTPLIVVNGLVYPGDPTDPDAFRAFVEEQAS